MEGRPFGSVWQFNLTRNATWTDGVPFTAHDVAYNINLSAHNFDTMWSTEPYAYFIKEAAVVDDHTVRIFFYDRQTGLPQAASFAPLLSIPILPMHLLEQLAGGANFIGMNWTGLFPDDISPGLPIVGTGPFMPTSAIMNEWTSGDHITLMRNPNYHWTTDKGIEVNLESILMTFFQDATSMTLALTNEELDVASFPPAAYDSIQRNTASNPYSSLAVSEGLKVNQQMSAISFNMRDNGPNPSRLDPTIRRAVAMATDKSYIVNNFYLGLAHVGSTLISPLDSFWHYEPSATERIQYNLTAASALLETNGYIDVDSDGVRECTIISPSVQLGYVGEGTKLTYDIWVWKEKPEEKDIAQYIKTVWRQIGVEVNITIVEESIWPMMRYPSYYPDLEITSLGSSPDPNFRLFQFANVSGNIWNEFGYHNPDFDTNYTLSIAVMDKAERKQHVDNCQRVYYNDSASIVLAYPHNTYAWRTDTFKGWGDWESEPGRSIDNVWSGNPLYFSLGPGPIQVKVKATPNPAKTHEKVVFNLSASHPDGKALTFTIEFGDGKIAEAKTNGGTTDAQYVEITHRYWWPATYTVTVWVSDGSQSYSSWTGVVAHEFQDFIEVEQSIGAALFVVAGIGFVAATSAYLLIRRAMRKGELSGTVPPSNP